MQQQAGPRGGAPPKAGGGGKKRVGGKPASGSAAPAHATGGTVVRVFVETSLNTKLLVAVAPETTVEGVKGEEPRQATCLLPAGRAWGLQKLVVVVHAHGMASPLAP